MSGDVAASGLRTAQQDLQAGRWVAAKEAFEAVLRDDESAEALFGLGQALWWLGDTRRTVLCHERAYAGFRRIGDPERAALTAIFLCLVYRASLGNHPASRGWLGRAESMVSDAEPVGLIGWIRLCHAAIATDGGDPASAETWAREALVWARETRDVDLELSAVSELGAALVDLGRIDDGMALLDEAMAGALAGEAASLDTVVLACCTTIRSCSRGGDFRRAAQWVTAADRFHERYGSPHLYTTCRTQLGAVLFATGAWEQAERELRSALEIGKTAEPAVYAEALGVLAELWLAQGRLDEAVRLLEGFEDEPATACAMSAVRMALGQSAVAVSTLRRRLRDLDPNCLEAATLTELLVSAHVERDALDEAADCAARLATAAATTSSEPIRAIAERASGIVLLAHGDRSAAEHLERSLAAWGRLGVPYEQQNTRILLSQALADVDRETAIAEARAALAGFERLGAARDADEAAALLRSYGVTPARSGPRGLGLLTKREREVLQLLGEGRSNPEIAQRLFVSRKTVEHHVASVLAKLQLSSRGEATAYAVRTLSAVSSPADR